MRENKALLAVLFSTIVLAACSTTGSMEGQDAAQGDAANASATTATATQADLSKRSVYFDFDKYNVKSEYTPVVQAHANELKKDTSRKVVIQGNTDERGSREYNLALGQRRAESVRKTMTYMGVSSSRIEVVSFGEEKPKAKGHDEASWAENRRADIVY